MDQIKYELFVDEHSRVTVEEWLATIRSYLYAPYRTQGRTHRGLDCGGVVLAPATDLGLTDLTVRGYSNQPDGRTYEWLLGRGFQEIERTGARPGDVLACDYGQGVQHIAVMTAREPLIRVIHAKRHLGVVEQRFTGRDLRSWTRSYRLRHFI